MKTQNVLIVIVLMAASGVLTANTVLEERLSTYAKNSGSSFSSQQGKDLWFKEFHDAETGKQRSCTSCHTKDATRGGKHAKTGKAIDPLAPSVNHERFTDAKKIEKWFKRNCKWVMGRECSDQEKGNFLSYLRSL
ncbi:MAG: DUF1924 domain-containing protein [Gammaproteobacteria bacterium]|nr:DUF1924 domain-containing protein [Gammaproteobacteria bacterium]MDH5731527.1 DUF1924 domain-containing protein [Gammaproteobacteria bacterium]